MLRDRVGERRPDLGAFLYHLVGKLEQVVEHPADPSGDQGVIVADFTPRHAQVIDERQRRRVETQGQRALQHRKREERAGDLDEREPLVVLGS